MFDDVPTAPADPILGLTEAWKADPRPGKVNLGAGVYQNDEGLTPPLDCVKAAEAAILAGERSKSYLPIAGDPEFGVRVEELVFGPSAREAGRRFTAHAPGGTGALRLGAEWLRDLGRARVAWVSRPTWPNHPGVFSAAGFEVRAYPYARDASRGVDADALLEALDRVPAGDLVVLHACCHNPSGADPDPGLWKALIGSAARAGWLPFLDNAYQGFGAGLEPDRAALSGFLESGLEFLVATSFSKNMGLYRERVGALTAVARGPAARDAVASRIRKSARALYSNPPSHGGETARRILSDAVLRDLWRRELDGMRGRIRRMREGFAAGLAERGAPADFSFVARQSGMFSFTGLTAGQADWLRERRGVYLTGDGRINVAGLTPGNLDTVCDAVADCLREGGPAGGGGTGMGPAPGAQLRSNP